MSNLRAMVNISIYMKLDRLHLIKRGRVRLGGPKYFNVKRKW